MHLLQWSGEPALLTGQSLQAWRKSLEEYGYGKSSIQNYVKVVNDFLRTAGQEALCIPKPLRNDLTGRTFGYLTVLEATQERRRRNLVWRCACTCGKQVDVDASMLLEGRTTSCGCLNIEILRHHNRYEEGTELRQALEEKILNPNSASGYVGVRPKGNKWVAYLQYKGVQHNLGTYSNIDDAVKARARAKEAAMEDARRIYEETDHLYGAAPHRPPRPEPARKAEPTDHEPVRRSDNTSGCTGVSLQYGKWNVSISVRGKRYRLGAYEELNEAIAVRRQAEDLVSRGELEQLRALCGSINTARRAQAINF